MKTKEQLRELYSSKWENYCKEIKPIIDNPQMIVKPTNPLLIYPNDNYESADIRVMIFGQETNDWEGIFDPNVDPNANIDRLFGVYNSFYNKEGFVRHGGQFWNGFGLFMRMLNAAYPNKTTSYVWNNIIKIGKAGQMHNPPEHIYEIEHKYFSVIEEEIRILKPHIILFLTGYRYDRYITDRLPSATIQPLIKYPQIQLAKVELPNVDFAYRTYHPNYLYRKGKGVIDAFFSAFIQDTKL